MMKAQSVKRIGIGVLCGIGTVTMADATDSYFA